MQSTNGKTEKPVDYKYIQGSCYFNEHFTDGRMTLNTDQTMKASSGMIFLPTRLNLKMRQTKSLRCKIRGLYARFIWSSLKFVYFEPGDFENVKGFYQLLVLGNYSLYRKYQVELRNPEAAGPGSFSSAARFIPQDSKYYIMDPDDNFREIINKKDLLLPDRDTGELESFIKAGKIKVKVEKDLIRFTEYLNQE